MHELHCTEPDCRTYPAFAYDHDGARHWVCREHIPAVQHRMEAFGRTGPLARNPVEFIEAPPRVVPEPNWKHQATVLGRQLAKSEAMLQDAHRNVEQYALHARGLEATINAQKREIEDLKILLETAQRLADGPPEESRTVIE